MCGPNATRVTSNRYFSHSKSFIFDPIFRAKKMARNFWMQKTLGFAGFRCQKIGATISGCAKHQSMHVRRAKHGCAGIAKTLNGLSFLFVDKFPLRLRWPSGRVSDPASPPNQIPPMIGRIWLFIESATHLLSRLANTGKSFDQNQCPPSI